MCLTVDLELTKKMLSSDKKMFTFYKVFYAKTENYFLLSPYQGFKFENSGSYEVTNPISLTSLKDEDDINGGCFHAFVEKDNIDVGGIVIPIKVKKEDIIAFGDDGDVCFKKFTLPTKEWNKIFLKKPITLSKLISLNFPRRLATKLRKNINKSKLDKEIYSKASLKKHNIIDDYFIWSSSPEGYNYWNEKYKFYEDQDVKV